MATKSAEPQRAEVIEEALEELEKLVDRVKALYEQYFLGIQKQAPAHLHTDMERKIRDLAQENIRNTAQRYRFNMLQQKFGSYNAYWRRTMRQIENGTYLRQLSKVGRKAAQSGEAIPEEILQAMPKRMREQVMRDRAAAIALAKRQAQGKVPTDELLTLADEHEPAFIGEPSLLKRDLANERRRDGAFQLDDEDFDLDAFLREAEAAPTPTPAPPKVATPPPKVAPPPPRAATVPPPVPAPRPPILPTTPPPRPPRPPTARVEPNDTIPTPMSGMPRPQTPTSAPSQQTRPIPVAPGSTVTRAPTPSPATLGGRAATPPTGVPIRTPPPGMSDGDVDALYSKYVAAKKMIGEDVAGPAAREKLLRTINAQAPKIMEQYKAKGVDFSIVVKDNQVIIKAKPKP